MRDPVRVGVAGLGRLGRTHLANVAERVPTLELAHVADAVEPVAREAGARCGVPWTTSFPEMLADPALEAVVIATPTPLHAEMVEQAAAAGKHIFCEKPVALTVADGLRAVAAARAAGVRLQIGFHRRFDPHWRAAMARIAAGDLGRVYLYRAAMRDMQPPSLDYLKDSGGLFLDMLIHEFDAARWMVGEIVEVTATGTAVAEPAIGAIGDADHGVAVLRFANGALGVLDGGRAAGYGYECSTEIVGSRATARIAPHRRYAVEWLTPGTAARDYVADFRQQFAAAYVAELEEFGRAVRRDLPVAVTGEDGIAAMLVARAAQRSFAERRPIAVEPLLGPLRAAGAPAAIPDEAMEPGR